MENTIVSSKLSRTVKSNERRPFHEWERAPKFIYSSTTEGQSSPSQSTVSPSTSFSSLDSGFIHGCSTPPPTAEEEVSNGIDDHLNGSNAQTTEQYPEASTPVLTRSSILRTSSQRLNAWNISPKHKPVDRKDSVRFKLSLPRTTDDVPYSDSDSDSNSGLYTIHTNVPKENIKQTRKSKELDQDSDWEPLILKLKDNKHSVRHKIKPGYVSQMKKIFSSQEDLRIDDFNTSSRKTNLKRHNSANDISNRHLSVVKTTVNPPQRTHSLNKISDRTDFKVLKEEHSDNSYIDNSVSKSTNIFNDKSNMHSQALNNLTEISTNKPGSNQSFSNITGNQASRKPVTSKKGKSFPDRTETQNSDNSQFRRTGSQSVSCSTDVSNDRYIRSRSMKTNGLREFLQKQYPNEDNLLTETVQTHTSLNTDLNNTSTNINTNLSNTSTSEVDQFISKFGLRDENTADWDKKTLSNIEKHTDEMLTKPLCSPRKVKLEVISPRKTAQESDNDKAIIKNELANVHGISNFQRAGSERISRSLKPTNSSKIPVRRTGSVKFQQSAEALKSFLKKRYPSQEDVFGEDQQQKGSSPETSRDMQDKSEIERLVFKFGLGSQSVTDWDKKTKANIDEYRNKMTPSSYSSRQMDPNQIECPPLTSPTDEEHVENISFIVNQNNKTTHDNIYSHSKCPATHDLNPLSKLVTENETNNLTLNSSKDATLVREHEVQYSATSLQEMGDETFMINEDSRSFIDVNSDTSGVSLSSPVDNRECNARYYVGTKTYSSEHESQNLGDEIVSIDQNRLTIDDEFDYRSQDMNKNEFGFEERFELLIHDRRELTMTEIPVEHNTDTTTESIDTEFGCTFKHENQHNVTDDISYPDPSRLHTQSSSQILQHVALQETVEMELSRISHQDATHNLVFQNTETEQTNNVIINRSDSLIALHKSSSQQQGETNKEDTDIFVSPSDENQELSVTTNEAVETVIPKRTPPRKPPRKKKSNADVVTIPSILNRTNIHDDLNSSIPCFLDVTNTREDKSCITYDHDLSHKTEIDHGRITNVQTSSTDPNDSLTDTIIFNSPNIDDNIDTQQNNATNIEDDYLQHVPFICNMPARRQRIANSELRNDQSTTNTEERKPSPCSGGVCCHDDVTKCKLCNVNDASDANADIIQENIKEEFVPIKQGNDIGVITDSHTKDRELSWTNFQTHEIETDKSDDETVLSTQDKKYSSNDDTSGYLDPENLNTDDNISPLDEAFKNTEQELCQTYLTLMDTWLAKRANRKTGDTFESDVDDWENAKSKLKMGTFLSNSEENNDSSSNNSEDSSVEGEYIVETSLEDENEVMGQQRGLTSNGKHTFGLPKYDENGDEVVDNLPSINEDDSENTIENTEFCQNTAAYSFQESVINSDESFNNYEHNIIDSNENGEECTDDLNSALKLNLDFLKEVEDEEEIDDNGQIPLLEVTNKRDLSLESSNLGKVNKHIEDHNNTNSEHKPKRFVTFDANSADDSEVIHACHTPGSECNVVDHVTTGKTLTPLIPHQQNTEDGVFSTTVDIHCEDFNLNNTSSVTDSASKIAIIQELNTSTMPEKSSGNTKTSQMSEYKGGKKITTKTTTSVNNDGYDEDQTEQKRNLAHLSETIAKLNGENNDDIIPEINQTITKLNGGNLVITTLTHRVVEEEDEDKGETALVPVYSSSNKNSYIVQDHKGDTYMIEDITDDSHESAYVSEYESMSNGSGSPQYQKIHNLKAHGNSGVDYNTAEEVILSLYNPNSMEYTETDERHYSGQYSDERHRRGHGQLQPYGYSDSSTNKQTTSYEYEDGEHPQSHPYGSSSSKTIKQSYEMSSDGPWVTDGKNSYAGSKDVNMKKEVTNQSSAYDKSGMNAMSAAYMVEANASIPQINPYFVQQPLIIPQLPLPQYNLLQLEPLPKKVTTGVQVTTEPIRQIEEHKIVTGPDETDSKRIQERPIYKSVALVKGPYESPKWHTAKKHKPYEPPEDEVDSGKKYKVVKSSASDDVKEETMEYSESTKTYTTIKTENVDTSGGQYLHDNRNVSTIDVGRNRNRPITINGNGEFIEPRYVTEKTINVGKPSSDGRQYRSTIEVNGNSFSGNKPRSYDQLDGYQSRLDSILNHQQNYHETPEPERKHYTDVDRDMKVVRGNILIKNNFDDGLDEFSDNINVFDHGFSMNKQNPLYNSDEDIYKSYEEEKNRQQERNIRDMENMAFETVDRFSKTKNVTRKADGERRRPPRSKQNLTNLLLSRLSTMESKDIRQTIDVKHHHEDIFGDPNLSQADGTSSRRITSSNYDTVTENVDLTMKDGKAFITITVTAERLTPVDYEFHVWRKNQAIVTRVVEIDFYADEQRRVLYDRVMDRIDDEELSNNNRYSHYTRRKPQEIVLSSQDTLDLFNELMDATGGEGDKEDITVKTRRKKTVLPENPFLY